MGTQLPSPKRGQSRRPTIFGPFLWPNGWMHQDATRYGGRPQPRRLCVRWGPSPIPKKGRSPQFSAHVYWGQTAAWIKMPLGTEIGLGLRDSVRWDPAPTPLKEHSPQFSAIVGCGQTAGWTKMPLGMKVGLGSGNFVFDGGPAIPRKKGTRTRFHTIFGPCLLWPNGWMEEDATWYGSRPRHRPHWIRRCPSCTRKGHKSPPPLSSPMSIVAMVGNLSYCWALVKHTHRF